jgi:2-keto-3-deoxy-L-rhamnonate aldolase RhmA
MSAMNYVFENKLKKNLKAGLVQYGVFVTSPSPEVVEVLALAGMDFVILDQEHTALGTETTVNMMRSAEIYGVTPIVRIQDHNPKTIGRYLDVGAHGIQIPMVNTAEETEKIVTAMKYYPEGKRGMSGGRGTRWGCIENYREVNNRESMTVVMCESKEAVDNIEKIVNVPGVDCVFIGSYDLSQSLGVPGETTHPLVEDAISLVLDKCKKANVIPGIVAPSLELSRKRTAQGFLYITVFDDMPFFLEQTQKRMKEIKTP